MPLEPEDLDPDPIRLLGAWLDDAEAAGEPLPNAFALATVSGDGEPSVRMLLARGIDPDGIRFYTNTESRKGRDLAHDPRVAAAFWWPALGRQARVSGRITQLSESETLEYWRTRPRGSRLSALVSAQGSPIASRAELEAAVDAAAARFPGEDVPLPAHWRGYLLRPRAFEFWESRADRLHDRVEYRPNAAGAWERRRLQP
jgi:pyridoxamine 5'-phosphate oxidase